MNRPDLKKLISGFLILASLASSGVLIFSRFGPTLATKDSENYHLGTQTSAFSEEVPLSFSSLLSGSSTETKETPSNMTTALASDIAKEIVNKNPLGPSTVNGISIPTNLDNLVGGYIENDKMPKTPEPKVQEDRLKIIKSPTKEDWEKYFEATKNLIDSKFQGDQFKSLKNRVESGADIASVDAFSIVYTSAELDLYNIAVPEPALSFHKTLIQTLDIGKNLYNTGILNSDPLRAMASLNDYQKQLNEISPRLLSEIQLLKLTLPDSFSKAPTKNSVAGIFGIETAYAIIPVSDWINWIENALQVVLNNLGVSAQFAQWFAKLATEVLKDQLIKAIVNAIMNWVNGGGNPKYVTNWESYLDDAFNVAAGQVIKRFAPELCGPLRPLILEALKPLDTGGDLYGYSRGRTPVSCTLDKVVGNIEDFYNDFGNGGWRAYGSFLKPNNNFFGDIIVTSDLINKQAAKAKEAAQNKALAGQGYTGTEICPDGGSAQGGECSDGSSSPEITTPGSSVGELTARGLASAIDQIVNAGDWTALGVQLVNFAIVKLTAAGDKGLRYGNVASSDPASKYSVCEGYPKDSKEYKDCTSNVDKTENPDNGRSGIRSIVLDQAGTVLEETKNTVDPLNASINTATSVLAILKEIVKNEATCPEEASRAKSEIITLESDYNGYLAKKAEIEQKIPELEAFIEEVKNHQPTTDLSYYNEKLSEMESRFGTPVEAAQERAAASAEVSRLQEKLQSASDLLKACLTP